MPDDAVSTQKRTFWRFFLCCCFGHAVRIPESRRIEMVTYGTTTVEQWERIWCGRCGQQLVHYFNDEGKAAFVRWDWVR